MRSGTGDEIDERGAARLAGLEGPLDDLSGERFQSARLVGARLDRRFRVMRDREHDGGSAIEHGVLAERHDLAGRAGDDHSAELRARPERARQNLEHTGHGSQRALDLRARAGRTDGLELRARIDREEDGNAGGAQPPNRVQAFDGRAVPIEERRPRRDRGGVHLEAVALGNLGERCEVARVNG